MNRVRGIIMLLAGCFAVYEGFRSRGGEHSLLAFGLGVLAFILGIWHLTRKSPRRLV
jgi:hypothetical protein